MGLRSLVKKGIKKLKKWQPLKTAKKIANFIPGGKEIAGRVESAIDAYKRRREGGESPGDALAAGVGVDISTPEAKAKMTGMLLLVGVGVLALFMFSRRR